MKLTVLERITLQNILPKEMNYVTLRIVADLRKALSFKADEIKALSLKDKDGKLTWNAEADGDGARIAISDPVVQLVRTQLFELDKDKKLTAEHLSLYEKFLASPDEQQ